MSPLEAMVVRYFMKVRNAACRGGRPYEQNPEVIAASVGGQVQRYPMFAQFVAVVSVTHEGDREANFFPKHVQAYLLHWPMAVALGKGDTNIDEQWKSRGDAFGKAAVWVQLFHNGLHYYGVGVIHAACTQ